MSLKAAFLLLLIPSLQAVEIRTATFNIGANLVVPPGGGAAFFDYGIGPAGTPDHDRVREVLGRIDADVVALQEIHTADVNAGDLANLAASLGYPHIFVAPTTNAFDNSLRVVFLSRFPFLTQTAIASPPGSRDMTRLIPAVKVDVPGTARDPLLISAHLKSGSAAADLFQRAVEMRRLTGFLTASGETAADNVIVMGDFNLSGEERKFTALPASGLPNGFSLGPDLMFPMFPIRYFTNPPDYFTSLPVTRIVPRQVDGSKVTFPRSGTAIDLFLVSPILASRPFRSEIYNSALDFSNSLGLPKAGQPLASGTSAAASDHLALFADFELDPALPYAFTAPGQTVAEAFDGFPGTYDPPPWVTTGGTWKGADDGAARVPGFRSYGPVGDPSLGFLTNAGNGTATARFVNGSTTTLNALRLSFTAEQWRAQAGGGADSLSVELIVGGSSQALPQLGFTAAANLTTGAVPGGTSSLRSTTVTGLAVPPGAFFELKFTFAAGAGGGAAPADIFVNEFHYDNAGDDVGEFIEIVAGPGFEGDFSDYEVLLYNGGDGKIYRRLVLEGADFMRTATVNSFDVFVSRSGLTLQNGPDGIAIVKRTGRQLAQFISYEGGFLGSEGIAEGLASQNIGVAQTGSDPVGTLALGLTGSGGTRADFLWAKIPGAHSPGQANAGQTWVSPVLQPQGIAIDNLTVTFVADSDGDGFTDAEEAVFGTDPFDAASRFVVSFEYPAPVPGTVRLSFPTASGRSYTVESGVDLTDWEDVATYTGTGALRIADFPVISAEGRRFYRIRVSVP